MVIIKFIKYLEVNTRLATENAILIKVLFKKPIFASKLAKMVIQIKNSFQEKIIFFFNNKTTFSMRPRELGVAALREGKN